MDRDPGRQDVHKNAQIDSHWWQKLLFAVLILNNNFLMHIKGHNMTGLTIKYNYDSHNHS